MTLEQIFFASQTPGFVADVDAMLGKGQAAPLVHAPVSATASVG